MVTSLTPKLSPSWPLSSTAANSRESHRSCSISTFWVKSGEIPLHIGAHISKTISHLLRALKRNRLVDRLFGWLAGHLTTYHADEFTRFTRSGPPGRSAATAMAALPPDAPPLRPPAAAAIAPGTFEVTFARLQQERSFDDMWDLVAEDAQRSWGSREHFVERMRRQGSEYELLEAQVGEVAIVPEWTDERRNRTYRNVARVAVRYRIRHGWREVALDRLVHLVPAAGGWRTLYYPQEN